MGQLTSLEILANGTWVTLERWKPINKQINESESETSWQQVLLLTYDQNTAFSKDEYLMSYRMNATFNFLGATYNYNLFQHRLGQVPKWPPFYTGM